MGIAVERHGLRGAPAAPAPAASEAPPRLHHEPALDGLRGLAVVAVVVFHLDRLQGGFLGVDLFFVLSGFLITSLLVVERRANGAIGLRAFWIRRARRLLPALFVVLAGVVVMVAALTPVADRPRFRGAFLATVGYVANWERMAADVSYWDIFSQPSPLDHTWSLAIEEQFYVVWPLVVVVLLVAGRRRRPAGAPSAVGDGGTGLRRLRALAIAGGLVSLALLALTYSPVDTNRAYFATDTRLGPTLLGAALATVAAVRPRRDRPPSGRAEAAGAAALVVVGLAFVAVDGTSPTYYRGGLAVFTVATLVVIATVTGGPPGRLARLLSVRPLVVLGTISYGVYLWHWPVIVYVTAGRARIDGPALDVLRVGLTLALAAVSYVAVEQPIRRGALRGRTAALTAVAAVAVLVGAATIVTRGPAPVAGGLEGATDGRALRIVPDEADVPAGATRLLVVGDSGPIFLGPALVDEAGRADEVAVAMVSQLDCSPVIVGGHTRYPDGRVVDRPDCTDTRREAWAGVVERFDPDVVVYYLASAGGVGEGLIDGDWVSDCDPPYDRYLEDALVEDAEVLRAGGARIVFATSPYVDIFTDDSRAKVDCRNATYVEVAAQVPGAATVDLNGFLAAETAGADGPLLRDFVHLSDEGAERVARWLVPQVPELAPGR